MSGFGNIFDQIKTGAKTTANQMGRAAKIVKLKAELATQKSERERHLKAIGTKVYAIYSKDKNLNVEQVTTEVQNELGLIERIDKRSVEIQDEIGTLQAEMRATEGGDTVVDASEVTDTTDDDSAQDKEDATKKDKPKAKKQNAIDPEENDQESSE